LKALQRAHGRTFLAWILLAWGCSVYQPDLLNDSAGSSSGGTPGHAGDAGSGGRSSATAGSVGAGNDSGSGNGGAGGGGAGSAGGHAGESSTAAGAGAAGEGGAMACVPETPGEFCTRVGKDCGTVDGTDNCGSALVGADCGVCSGFKLCGGGGQESVCGALTDPTLGGMATASSVMFSHEDGSKAFDLDITSKWYAGDTNATGWLAYQFPGTDSHVVTSYSITSANDMPGRDPSAWELQGSNDGSSWVTVDQRTAQVFAGRRQTNPYTCANATAYRWYRLLVTANSGATSLQLAELVLYGN